MDQFDQFQEWFQAVIANDAKAVGDGLADGLNIEARTNRGRTAIMIAAQLGNGSVVDVLLQNGADIDARVDMDAAGAMDVELGDEFDQVADIIRHKAQQIPDSDADGRAFADGLMNFVEALQDPRAAEPIAEVAVFAEPDELELLFDAFDPTTALTYAIACGRDDVAYQLIDAGAELDALAWDDTPPLAIAAIMGNLAMAERLVRDGALVDEGFDVTPLEAAREHGHTEIVELLTTHGAGV